MISGLKCPKCKSGFTYIDVLASNPPQYEFNCGRCDYTLRYYERKNPNSKITQEEIDNDYKLKSEKNY